MKRVLFLVMLVMWVPGCATGPGPKEVMGRYLDAYAKGTTRKHTRFFPPGTRLRNPSMRSPNPGDLYSRHSRGRKSPIKSKESRPREIRPKATVQVATPDIKGVFGELFGAIMAMVLGREQDDNALEDVLAEKLEGKNWPTITTTEYYDLVKEQDGWKCS